MALQFSQQPPFPQTSPDAMSHSAESEKHSASLVANGPNALKRTTTKLSTEKHEYDLGSLEAERKRVLRKMDFHLLPFISMLYLLSFLYAIFPPFFLVSSLTAG